MDEVLAEFQKESKDLLLQCHKLLDEVEDDVGRRAGLGKFSNLIDRIMGASETIVTTLEADNPGLNCISQLTRLCKIIGYRSVAITDEAVYNILVSFLQDAVEIVDDLVKTLETATKEDVQDYFHEHLVKRMHFVAAKLPKDGPLLASEKTYTNKDIQNLIDSILS